ncbi:MAG: hypothetical protein BWX72_00576 [Firmicutes bacterium ADurb.Bin080]|jgi:hypothetical protein|nr:hypothetical protein [Clostridiales bacterium]OQC16442.1 MAG: hypothetical protein BWX72_00576 [Firmicutes bacterium ADurb.Bin080]
MNLDDNNKENFKSNSENNLEVNFTDKQTLKEKSITTNIDSSSTQLRKKISKTKKKNNGLIWAFKITFITLFLAAFFSLISEFTNYFHYIISIILLFILIFLSLIADAIGVAATSCNPEPIYALASRKEPGSKQALLLIRNAEKVSNICCDVIGDICGIVSGALLIGITYKFSASFSESAKLIINIAAASIVAGFTVGGKAFFKNISVRRSKDIVLLTARFISIFYNPKDMPTKKKKK